MAIPTWRSKAGEIAPSQNAHIQRRTTAAEHPSRQPEITDHDQKDFAPSVTKLQAGKRERFPSRGGRALTTRRNTAPFGDAVRERPERRGGARCLAGRKVQSMRMVALRKHGSCPSNRGAASVDARRKDAAKSADLRRNFTSAYSVRGVDDGLDRLEPVITNFSYFLLRKSLGKKSINPSDLSWRLPEPS